MTVLTNVGVQLNIDGKNLELPWDCRRIIFMPIKYQGSLEGYLVILESQDHVYPFNDELTLLKILATQIAPIIGSRKIHSGGILELNDLDPTRAIEDLVNAELNLSDSSESPVTLAMTRLVATGSVEQNLDLALLREDWRNLIAAQLGPDKRIYWAGYDTLIILAGGGNPVGLDHHLANVRNELESGGMSSKTYLSMAYSILTYPFDADSVKKVIAKLSSNLFNAVGETKSSQ